MASEISDWDEPAVIAASPIFLDVPALSTVYVSEILSIEGSDDPVIVRSKLFLAPFLTVKVWDEQETDFFDGRISLIEVSWVSAVSLDETVNWTFFAVGDSDSVDWPEGSDFVLSGWVVVSDP